MQADAREIIEHIGNVAQLGPIVLDVLTGGEVAIAFVISLGQIRKQTHLGAIERSIGDRHAQHIGVQL